MTLHGSCSGWLYGSLRSERSNSAKLLLPCLPAWPVGPHNAALQKDPQAILHWVRLSSQLKLKLFHCGYLNSWTVRAWGGPESRLRLSALLSGNIKNMKVGVAACKVKENKEEDTFPNCLKSFGLFEVSVFFSVSFFFFLASVSLPNAVVEQYEGTDYIRWHYFTQKDKNCCRLFKNDQDKSQSLQTLQYTFTFIYSRCLKTHK